MTTQTPLYIKHGKVSVRNVSVTLGVASSVANDVIIRTGAASAVGGSTRSVNDITMRMM